MEFDEESQTPEIFFHLMIGLSSTASWTSFSSTETSTRRLLRRWSAPCYLFRSAHDRAMPEEIKRVLTDQLSILLFPVDANLKRERVSADKIHFDSVGNVMIER
jgi:hypothetical protein